MDVAEASGLGREMRRGYLRSQEQCHHSNIANSQSLISEGKKDFKFIIRNTVQSTLVDLLNSA